MTDKRLGQIDSDTRNQVSRAQLLENISRIENELDRIPTKDLVESEGEYPVDLYIDEFGSWTDTIIEYQVNLETYLLREFEKLRANIGEPPTASVISDQGEFSQNTYFRVFDSWEEIKAAASDSVSVETDNAVKADDSQGEQDRETNPKQDKKPDSEEPDQSDLVDELVQLRERTNGVLKASDMRNLGRYKIHHYTNEFGSWDMALEEAGVDRREQLLDEIRDVWQELGHKPSQTDMNKKGGVSATTVTNYFESWDDACESARPDSHSDYLSNVDKLLHYEDIYQDTRLNGTYVAKVTWRTDALDHRKETKIRTEDIFGTECWVHIWKTHQVDVDFYEGHWFALTNLEGEELDKDGKTTKRLHSTTDLTVDPLGTEPSSEVLHREAANQGLLEDNSNISVSDGTAEQTTTEAEMEGPSGEEKTGQKKEKDSQGYTEEEIRREIRTVALKVGWVPSSSDMEEHGNISLSTIRNYFGTWSEAREAAGVANMSSEKLGELRREASGSQREELLKEINNLYNQIGATITPADIVSFGKFNEEEYEEIFGSVANAMQEAGVY